MNNGFAASSRVCGPSSDSIALPPQSLGSSHHFFQRPVGKRRPSSPLGSSPGACRKQTRSIYSDSLLHLWTTPSLGLFLGLSHSPFQCSLLNRLFVCSAESFPARCPPQPSSWSPSFYQASDHPGFLPGVPSPSLDPELLFTPVAICLRAGLLAGPFQESLSPLLPSPMGARPWE